MNTQHSPSPYRYVHLEEKLLYDPFCMTYIYSCFLAISAKFETVALVLAGLV